MGAFYYLQCPRCDSVIIATDLQNLRNDLEWHLDRRHMLSPESKESIETIGQAMPTSMYYKSPMETPSPKDTVGFPAFHNPDGDNEHMKELARAKLSKETGKSYHVNCPCCPAVFTAATVEEIEAAVNEHANTRHAGSDKERGIILTFLGIKVPVSVPQEPSAPAEPASTYVFTCPACGTFMGAPTYKDLVKSVEQHMSHKHITSLSEVKLISDEFYSGLPEDYCIHLLGYSLASTDDPENPVVLLDTTLPKNQWDVKKPSEPTSLDSYQYCPECGECLEADSIGALRDCFVRHYQTKHPSIYRGGLGDKEVRHLWGTTTVFYGPKPAPPPSEPATPTPAKPPLGIQPEHLWREHRMYELIACINRYHESGFPVKPEWLEELRSILVKHAFAQAVSDALEPFRTNNPAAPKETK